MPATYFTRNFDTFKSYIGSGKWHELSAKLGPPWNHTKTVPRKALACFDRSGQGIAVFSPNAEFWNYGPNLSRKSKDPLAAPCVHIAPVASLRVGRRANLKYRYWLVTGTESQIAKRLDALWEKYKDERAELTNK